MSLFSLVEKSPPSSGGLKVNLSFTVRLARSEEHLISAIKVRSEAYSRHLPDMGEMLRLPEEVDTSIGMIVFLAESKMTGEAIGTLRIQKCDEESLLIEDSIELPVEMKHRPRISVTRLAVKAGRESKEVKLALFKAMLLYCLAMQIDWIVIAARSPIDRTFEYLGFDDVFEKGKNYPIQSARNKLHRILVMCPRTLERTYFAQEHALHGFFFRQFHPDIEIFKSISNRWSSPRKLGRVQLAQSDDGSSYATV